MYNRSPYSGYQVSEGVPGRLMGRTLGYLGLLLGILAVATLFGPVFGTWGVWVGFGAAIIGTIMVSRRVANAAAAFAWGVVVAIGMGILVAPVLWGVAATDPALLLRTFGVLILAVLMSAALVSFIPWDFSRMMPLLFVGLIMLIVVNLLSLFVPAFAGVGASRAFNLIGVLIFTGYLMVDFSLMRFRGRVVPSDGTAVVLAVSLLIDIVNLFLFLLRLGRR
ncbi:MAG: Bax inhibitor-1 family protein [Sulfobacillus sp.]